MSDYGDMVASLKKHGDLILSEINGQQMDALHMAVGLSGEAGELLDCIKKWVVYQKPLDMENLTEELGDIEFYLEGIRQCLAIDRELVLAKNETKLRKRYGDKYSNTKAIERADKV